MRLIASSITAASRAGKIIRDVMNRGDLGIIDKGKNDLQTEADRSAQRCIVASLSQMFPNLAIIGEEGVSNLEVPSDWIVTEFDESVLAMKCPQQYLDIQQDDVTVWVDPLDGTGEYTQGFLDHVTVLVGIALRGNPIAGVIHQPYHNYKAGSLPLNTCAEATDPIPASDAVVPSSCLPDVGRTMWGLIGLGVGGFKPISPPKGKFIVCTTRTHATNLTQQTIEAMKADQVIRIGGAGYKVLLLMEGKAHAYVFPSPGCKKWDTCAPEAVLRAMNGCLTDITGKEYKYDADAAFPNSLGVVATTEEVTHDDIIKLIPDEVKSELQNSSVVAAN